MEPAIPRDPTSYTLSRTSLHQSPVFTDEARVTCLDVVWLYPNFLVPQCHLEQASLPQSGPRQNSKNVPQLLPQLRPHPGESKDPWFRRWQRATSFTTPGKEQYMLGEDKEKPLP